MAMPKSRTYRLRLSEEGTDAFLTCHYRLARVVRRFTPYGATLTVAMLLAQELDGAELSAELSAPAVERLAGHIEHFVGASPDLREAAANMLGHVESAAHGGSRATMVRLFATAIALMCACDDREIARAYGRIGNAFATPGP